MVEDPGSLHLRASSVCSLQAAGNIAESEVSALGSLQDMTIALKVPERLILKGNFQEDIVGLRTCASQQKSSQPAGTVVQH